MIAVVSAAALLSGCAAQSGARNWAALGAEQNRAAVRTAHHRAHFIRVVRAAKHEKAIKAAEKTREHAAALEPAAPAPATPASPAAPAAPATAAPAGPEATGTATAKPAPLPPIPLPDPTLLVRQPEPPCEVRLPGTLKADEAQRIRTDYEHDCFKHAEIVVRTRLHRLQDSVVETINAVKSREQTSDR
jgi:hypothetical protein